MTWNEWCAMEAGDQIDAVQMWEDGEDADGLVKLFLSFLDDFLLRFKPGSKWENASDFLLTMGGPQAFAEIKPKFLALLGMGLHSKPFEKLAVT